MKRLATAAGILALWFSAALAQSTFTMPPPAGVMVGGFQVVATCGAATLAPNALAFGAMDATGKICTNASGGGGGGAVTIADGADVTQGAKADSVCGTATGTCTILALLKYIANAVSGAIPAGSAVIGTVNSSSQYPTGATAITATATGTTGATTATLAGTSGKTTFICGLSIRANATASATGNATVTGTITGTINFTQWTAPAASGIGVVEQVFNPCVPASATNTAIAIISAAPGTGGVVSSTGWGYQL